MINSSFKWLIKQMCQYLLVPAPQKWRSADVLCHYKPFDDYSVTFMDQTNESVFKIMTISADFHLHLNWDLKRLQSEQMSLHSCRAPASCCLRHISVISGSDLCSFPGEVWWCPISWSDNPWAELVFTTSHGYNYLLWIDEDPQEETPEFLR